MRELRLFLILLSLGFGSDAQQLICNQRDPEGHSGSKRPGDGSFDIKISGKEADKGQYVPNEVYTVTIKGLTTRYSTKKFMEFLLVTESEKMLMMGGTGLITTGIFHIVDDSLTRFSDICPDGLTNSNLRPKTEISVLWTAPSVLVASCITFKATVVERPHIWYMDDGGLTKTLCPHIPTPPTTTSTPPPPRPTAQQPLSRSGAGNTKCCACDEAKYDITFEGIWSAETHPKDFPENKFLLHFSDIIGASHSPDFYFWEVGKLGSPGIKHVAEWGATRVLENELKAKSRHINTIIKARGLWYPNERGETSAAFRVDRSRHLMSLVTMIGPSPDWFVGVSGYDLCTLNCTWLEEANFDLYPYDAGSDNGISYMSQNDPTTPSEVITRLSESEPNDTRSPFYDPTGKRMEPFAKLRLRRQRIYPKSCDNTELRETENHEIVVSENTEDVGRPECAVQEWSAWSDCSVTCGKGLRMRKRSYLIPFKADMMRCDRQLEEKEMCLGVAATCADEQPDEEDEMDKICEVTKWSEWTPCDRTCGKGSRSRNRRYRNHMGRKKCGLEMTQTEECIGESEDCQINSAEIDHDPDCLLSPWSEYSPCSTTCGIGFQERTRFFLLSLDAPIPAKCLRLELTQNVTCVGEYGESCDIGMEDAKEICRFEPDVGPCRFWKEAFFFSPEKGMCLSMRYGGCKGNRNRFDTESDCLKTCAFLNGGNSTEVVTTVPPPVSTTVPTPASTTESTPVFVATTVPPPVLITEPTTTAQEQGSEEETTDEAILEERIDPIDCVVSKFSDWSLCSGECGELGYMTRSREIIIEPVDGKYEAAKPCPKHLKKRRICRVLC